MKNKPNEFKTISETIKLLDSINHPDSYRIAKEICEFTNFDIQKNEDIIKRLSNDEPWEYIRGYVEFDGNILNVSSSTLIPRVETLQILDIVSRLIRDDISQIIDIGSGSGAIGLSLAKRFPKKNIVLIEKYAKTLEVLKENMNNLNFYNAKIVKSDLLTGFKVDVPTIIVANLPYIPTNDYVNLQKSVLNYEPKEALEAGADGLNEIRALLESINDNENVQACILEIDPKQKSTLEKMDLKFIKEFIKDFRGLFRFLKLYR